MRKLKSIETILKENPDYYFDSEGNLEGLSTREIDVIYRFQFRFFDGMYLFETTDSLADGSWSFDSEWFEPEPEQKKLYAFKLENRVDYFVQENEIYLCKTEYKRAPEYDLEFKE